MCPVKDKDPPAPAPADPVTFSQTPPPTEPRQQYEELDGDVLEYPSTFTSPAPSEGDFSSSGFSNQAEAAAPERRGSYFSLRRLSTPPLSSPVYQPIDPTHTSLPSFPKLGLLSRTYKALQRRGTVAGSRVSSGEHSRLTGPPAATPEEPIPLAPLGYGSTPRSQTLASPKPRLNFTMAFSAEQQTLVVTVLGLAGVPHRLQDVCVLCSLPPLHPSPTQTSGQDTLSPIPGPSHSQVLRLQVSSVAELQRCVLRVTVNTHEGASPGGHTLGELEVDCGGRDWRGERPFHFSKELKTNTLQKTKVLSYAAKRGCVKTR